ncbi:MAG: glycosyl transferase-like UDP-glucuronosyltransferase [Sphingosinicella sp.]|uniref:glycosyl transferase-like UDP-glucuronosyltransferase n=1 Tax=Sphingosinicella sp. TaxID=1917971 RepID=UPI0040380130
MARILLAWEFGANRGHVVPMIRIAAILRSVGHEIHFAVQRLDAFAPGEAVGAPVWQAPVSPRLLSAVPAARAPAGFADVLARLGMDDPRLVAAMINAWRHLLSAVRPDLVVADYAPFLLMAARGRVPTIAVGTGFSLPPADLAELPVLVEGGRGVDQGPVLDALNAGLAEADAEPMATLAAAFRAERALPVTFAELDPYAAHRPAPPAHPLPPDFAASVGEGSEVFVYADARRLEDSPLWRGLAEAGLPMRVHVPRMPDSLRAALVGHGFAVEPEPLPFAAIAARSRLVVSHGGHGLTCACLAAGLPHVVFYYDLEKLLTGLALARLGVGGHVSLPSLEPRAFAESLVQVHRDDAMLARARGAAPAFLARDQAPLDRAVAEAAAALL